MVLVDKNLVGRCGLYCGSCIIYRASRDSEKLRRVVAEKQKCKLEEIRCGGCQTALTSGWDVKGEEWGKNCKIVKCLTAKGLSFCYECNGYPNCERFHEIADSCLKFGEDLMGNLEKIMAGKVEEWLREEDGKWRCKSYGKPISIHLTECHWCGAKLDR
jgi:hypothetical protein